MKTFIRRAARDDIRNLWNLRRESILQLAIHGMPSEQARKWAEKRTIEDIEAKFDEEELYVAEVNGATAGWASFSEDFLTGLYSAPEFSRKGVGSGLLNFVEDLMRRRGVEIIRA